MSDLTIVIPVTSDRSDMLALTMESLNKCGADVLVYQRESGEMTFGALINAAVEGVKTRNLCLTIADTIWTPRLYAAIDEKAETLNAEPAVFGAIRLERSGDDILVFKQSLFVPVLNCFLVRTIDFRAIGGMNPFFDGWGFYEPDFINRAREARRIRRVGLVEEVYWHTPHPGKNNPSEDEEKRNEKISKTSWFDGKEWKRVE